MKIAFAVGLLPQKQSASTLADNSLLEKKFVGQNFPHEVEFLKILSDLCLTCVFEYFIKNSSDKNLSRPKFRH